MPSLLSIHIANTEPGDTLMTRPPRLLRGMAYGFPTALVLWAIIFLIGYLIRQTG